MVIDRNIRQRNALFGVGSLADIRQLQIALCGSDLAEPENSETKSEWLKRDCFHIVAVFLSQFFIFPYQINKRCLKTSIYPSANMSPSPPQKKKKTCAPAAGVLGGRV